jgi:hypothetical protein
VLLSCIIDVKEERYVAVVDIPNAFVQTRVKNEKDMAFIKIRGIFAVVDIPNAFVQTRVENEKDMTFIKIRGILVEILVEIAPYFNKPYDMKDKKGAKKFLVQCQNSMYGTMVASLLCYRKFVKSLTDIDFVIDPYDMCVANNRIEGKQMTICFHVDDCKLSHRKKKVVDSMIECLRQEYESIFEDGSGAMTVRRGNVSKYLGMTLYCTVCGQVKITMFNYFNEILAAFDKAEPKVGGTKSSAAPESLFKVDEYYDKFKQDKAVEFHNLVAKTLYTTKREMTDTCTVISFLKMRVLSTDKDDWTKLVHLMMYITGTHTMPLILSDNGSGILKWWVDASFDVHPNMRGHS